MLKWERDMHKPFQNEDVRVVNKHMFFNFISNQGNANSDAMAYYYIPTRIANTKFDN